MPAASSASPAAAEPADHLEQAVSTDRAGQQGVPALTERERLILDFEDQWWKYGGAKDQAIRAQFSLSATTYYQVLSGLLDRQEALAYKPMLVKRLRRLRTTRHRARSARRRA